MAYEEDKDVLVKDFGTIEGTPFTAQTRAYDDGAEKLCVYRAVGQKGKLVKVLRLPVDEAAALGRWLVTLSDP